MGTAQKKLLLTEFISTDSIGYDRLLRRRPVISMIFRSKPRFIIVLTIKSLIKDLMLTRVGECGA